MWVDRTALSVTLTICRRTQVMSCLCELDHQQLAGTESICIHTNWHNTVITGTVHSICGGCGNVGGGGFWRNHRTMQRHPTHKAVYVSLVSQPTELWVLVVYWHIWGMRGPCFQTLTYKFYITYWHTKNTVLSATICVYICIIPIHEELN
jgi:hypothetical protein